MRSGSSCLHLPSAGIAGVHHYKCPCGCWGVFMLMWWAVSWLVMSPYPTYLCLKPISLHWKGRQKEYYLLHMQVTQIVHWASCLSIVLFSLTKSGWRRKVDFDSWFHPQLPSNCLHPGVIRGGKASWLGEQGCSLHNGQETRTEGPGAWSPLSVHTLSFLPLSTPSRKLFILPTAASASSGSLIISVSSSSFYLPCGE